jgi:hypothetical protein
MKSYCKVIRVNTWLFYVLSLLNLIRLNVTFLILLWLYMDISTYDVILLSLNPFYYDVVLYIDILNKLSSLIMVICNNDSLSFLIIALFIYYLLSV